MNWQLKLLVASLFATSASFGPFFSLFMQDKGFDALQIGSMISLSRIVMLLSTPAACAYADRKGTHRGLLAALAFGAACVILTFPLAPSGNFGVVALIFALYSMCCGSKLAICDTIVLHSCRGMAEKYPLQRLWGSIAWGVVAMMIGFFLRWYHSERREAGLPITYELVPVIHAFFQFCFATVLLLFIPPTTTPAATGSDDKDGLSTVGRRDDDDQTGNTARTSSDAHEELSVMYALESQCNRGVISVDTTGPMSSLTCGGSGMVVTTSGVSPVPSDGETHHHRLTTAGAASTASSSVSMATRIKTFTSSMTKPPTLQQGGALSNSGNTNSGNNSDRSTTGNSTSSSGGGANASNISVFSVLKGYARLSKDRRILFPVVFGVSLLALSEVAMNNFLFPYLRRALKAPPELFSYLLAIHSVSEVCAFTMGSQLVQWIGPRNMLIISSLAFCTKSTWYALLEDPWTLLYVEMLHGVCFALMWTAAVAHVSKISESFNRPDAPLIATSSSRNGTAGGEASSVGDDEDSPVVRPQDKCSNNVRAASMAMTTLWFFANGLPNILGGVISGYVVQHAESHEIALFQLVGGLAFAVAALFWMYGVFGCFG